MALQGSATVNLSPILTKATNRIRSINLIIHQDNSGSMTSYSNFFSGGDVIEQIQNSLLSKGIGNLTSSNPNLYAFFDTNGRDPSSSFSISNSQGTLSVSQSFMRGESTGSLTKSRWISNYISRDSSHRVNVLSSDSEDVHGNLWSIFTSPNSINNGAAGRYGSIISNSTRQNSKTFIITASDEQSHPNRIDENYITSSFNSSSSGTNLSELTISFSGPSISKRSNGLNYFFHLSGTTYNSGLSARRYTGYFDEDVNYTNNLSSIEGPIYRTQFLNFWEGSGSYYNNTTWVIDGYFYAPTNGNYTFFTNSDDASYLWVGSTALNGYTISNAVVKNGGIHPVQERSGSVSLIGEVFYPIKIIFGNQNLGGSTTTSTRPINGPSGEMIFRGYRVIALSSYNSNDGYAGVLFYESTSPQPYGYVSLTNDNYTVTRSSTASNWTRDSGQNQDTLTLASETRGALFKLNLSLQNNKIGFAKCIADFISNTI